MSDDNMDCGNISKEVIEDQIKKLKGSAGKKIEGPVRMDNAFGAAFRAIDEYKREHDKD